MSDSMVLHILETSSAIKSLRLPFNSKITGWFLEDVLEKKRNSGLVHLTKLILFINTAYVDIQTVIPELYAESLVNDLENLNLFVNISFIHKKLTYFNPKDFDY